MRENPDSSADIPTYANTILNIGDEGLGNTIVGVIFAVIVIVASILLLPRTIALYNIYSFFNVWWINLYGTVGQFAAFYQGSEACMPGDEAPHFSNVQYISNASLVNSLLSLISMWAAGVCFRNMRLRTLLWFTSFLVAISAIVDICVVMRWNLGSIPDNVLFFMGTPSTQFAAYSINFLVSTTLTAKLCPEGVETTVYGLLAATSNFGGPISAVIANGLSKAFNLETDCFADDAADCNCNLGGGNSNFAWFIAINHIFFPLLLIPLTFFLVPAARMSDQVLTDDEGRITEIRNVKQQRDERKQLKEGEEILNAELGVQKEGEPIVQQGSSKDL